MVDPSVTHQSQMAGDAEVVFTDDVNMQVRRSIEMISHDLFHFFLFIIIFFLPSVGVSQPLGEAFR